LQKRGGEGGKSRYYLPVRGGKKVSRTLVREKKRGRIFSRSPDIELRKIKSARLLPQHERRERTANLEKEKEGLRRCH